MTQTWKTTSADEPKQRGRRRWRLLAIFLLAAFVGGWAYWHYFDTYRQAIVTPGVLYRSGMRNTREFANTLRELKPKTVVCLVIDAEVADTSKGDFQGEFALLKRDGIGLIRIPVKLGGPPTGPDIQRFLAVVNDTSKQPVLVHCAQGVVRTGMMVAAYQKEVLGYDKQQALAAVNIFGKGQERGVRVRWFIENYYDGTLDTAATQPAGPME